MLISLDLQSIQKMFPLHFRLRAHAHSSFSYWPFKRSYCSYTLSLAPSVHLEKVVKLSVSRFLHLIKFLLQLNVYPLRVIPPDSLSYTLLQNTGQRSQSTTGGWGGREGTRVMNLLQGLVALKEYLFNFC